MNDSVIWLIVSVLVGILFLVYTLFLKKGKAKANYKSLFYLGLVVMAIGLYEIFRSGDVIFFILGIVYVAVGSSKMVKWKKS